MTSVVSWEHTAGAQETALQSAGLIRGMHVGAWEEEAIPFDCKAADLTVAMEGWARWKPCTSVCSFALSAACVVRAGMSPSPAKHKRKGPMKRTDNSGSKLSDSEFEAWNAAVRDAAKGKADEEYATRKAMHENGDTAKAIELVEKGPSDKVELGERSKDQVSKERPKKVYKPDREKCGIELEANAMKIVPPGYSARIHLAGQSARLAKVREKRRARIPSIVMKTKRKKKTKSGHSQTKSVNSRTGGRCASGECPIRSRIARPRRSHRRCTTGTCERNGGRLVRL